MRLHKLAIMALALAMTLIIAACDTGNGDDEDTNGVEDPVEETDDATEEEPTEAEDEEATDEESTPEDAATEDEATPEATEEDDTTGDDTEGMGEQETAQVTIGSDELTIEQGMMGAENGTTDEEETPEATGEEDDEEAMDEEGEETPEATDDVETPEATDDDEDDMAGMDGEAVTFASGNIMFEITNDADSPFSLAIEESGGAMGEATEDEETPEATDDEEETPEATEDDEETPEATDEEDEDSAGMNGDSMAVEELGETIDSGGSTEWEVELEPGDYVMYVVSEDGEREEGMEAEFTVEEGGMMNGADDEATPEATEDEETPEATEDEETPEAGDEEDEDEEDD